MGSSANSGWSGLLGGLQNAAQSGLLGDIGMGLLSASHYGSNPGEAMEQALAAGQQRRLAQQQYQLGQIDLQRQRMLLPFMQAYYRSAMGPQGSQGAPQPQAAPQAAPAVPQQVAAAPVAGGFSPRPVVAPPAAPDTSAFSVPTPDQIASLPVGGMSPDMLRMGGLMSGQSPLATAQQVRAQQIAIAQQKYAPTIARLDTLAKAQSPTQYVNADPALKAEWQKIAPGLGFDPAKDFKDANVRTAFSFLRNQMAGALGEPSVAPPVQVSQVRGPLNSLYNRNPLTGALSQVRGEEGLKEVVGPNGQVTYVPASQATGQQAFNSDTYINPGTTGGLADLIASYRAPPLSGFALRSAQGQAIMAQVKQINPSYDATTYPVKQRARQQFATGKQGDIVRSLSVATNHLDQLSDAAHALGQNNLPALNHVVNSFATAMGKPSVTNFDAMKEIVGDEVVKAVVGTSGAESDREAIKEAFHNAKSPDQLEGVISKYEGLMGGQLSGLRRQYERSTGLQDFNSFVSDLARQKLDNGPTTPTATSDAALLKKWGGT